MLVGIVGKPNVGKSTFFKAATLSEVAIAPYPFTTIEANEGVGFVKVKCPDQELRLKCNPRHGFCINGWRFIPVKLLDVAGLIPGAHLGKGLGNKFLDDLRQADVLIHVVDASGTTDAEGKATTGYDPCFDIHFLEDELDKWLHGIIAEQWQLLVKKINTKKPLEILEKQLSGLKINAETIKKAILNCNLEENFAKWTDEELLKFVRELRKLSKPLIIAANKMDLPESRKNFEKLKREFPLVIPCYAEAELALREAAKKGLINYIPGERTFEVRGTLNEEQKEALDFVKKILEKEEFGTGVQECLNKAIFDLLKYFVVYPVENENHFSDSKGNVLPDAFLMPPNSTALDLAREVHSEIAQNFIAAIDARTHKRLAKDYKLKNGDIVRILV